LVTAQFVTHIWDRYFMFGVQDLSRSFSGSFVVAPLVMIALCFAEKTLLRAALWPTETLLAKLLSSLSESGQGNQKKVGNVYLYEENVLRRDERLDFIRSNYLNMDMLLSFTGSAFTLRLLAFSLFALFCFVPSPPPSHVHGSCYHADVLAVQADLQLWLPH
jgi:hypothetical protein